MYDNCSDKFQYKYNYQEDEEGTIAYEFKNMPYEFFGDLFSEHDKYSSFPFHYEDFYLTEDKIWLIINGTSAMGDKLEFFSEYSNVIDFSDKNNEIWREIYGK